jgi:hypothetical protein
MTGVEIELADRLAIELNVLVESTVTGVDVLRALVAASLKLVPDADDEAFSDYENLES